MASVDRLVRIILKLDDQFSGPIGRAGSAAQNFSKTATRVGGVMTAAVTLPLAAAGAAAIKTAIDFETGFTGVMKTIDGTAEEMETLRKELESLATSAESPVSALANAHEEIFKIAETAGQLGVPIENVKEFTDVMGQLAMSTNVVGEEGAKQLARFANATQFDLSNIRQLGDVIVDLGNNMATTEAEILTFGKRMSTISDLGFQQDEILAIGAAMSSLGLNAEAGSSAFVKGAQEMALAAATGGAGLEVMADVADMTAQQFQNLMKSNPAEAILAFSEGLGDMDLVDQVQALESLNIKGVRMRDTFLKLAGNTELLANSLDIAGEAFAGNGALLEEAQKRADTVAGKINRLKNLLTQAFADIGRVMMPIVSAVLDVLITLVTWFNKLPDGVKRVIVIFAALVAVIGPLLLIIGGLVSAFGTISAGFSAVVAIIPALVAGFGAIATALPAIAGGLAAVALPILPLIALLVALKIAWDKNFLGLRDKIQETPGIWRKNFEMLGEIVKLGAGKIMEHLGNLNERIANSGLVQAMKNLGANIIHGLISGIISALTALNDTITKMGVGIVNRVKNIFQIGSPSKVMMIAGAQVGQGFNVGLAQEMSKAGGIVAQASQGVVRSINHSIQGVSRLNSGVRNTRRGAKSLSGTSRAFSVIGTSRGTERMSAAQRAAAASAGRRFGLNQLSIGQSIPAVSSRAQRQAQQYGGGNVNIQNLNVPPGTTREQVQTIMREVGREVKRQGGSGIK